MSDVLIEVENVSKKFCRNLKTSLWYGLKDLSYELTGNSVQHDHLRPEEFWAVNDISFQLRRGSCLGLIGHNGAGKTTLLRMLNGLIKPDRGKITVRGRVGALIALGVGFNPILTGRDNIYGTGAMLGLSTREINMKYDAIVDFSELHEFMDMPLQSYSSGMQVRLGFSIASQIEADILILDEVLAVGDSRFRAKCFNHMYSVMSQCATVFVSHSLPHVGRVATEIMVMHKGRLEYCGDNVPQGIDRYNRLTEQSPAHSNIYETGSGYIDKFSIDPEISYSGDMKINFELYVDLKYSNPIIEMVLVTQERIPAIQMSSPAGFLAKDRGKGAQTISMVYNNVQLNPGKYLITIAVSSMVNGKILMRYNEHASFVVIGKQIGFAPVLQDVDWDIL